jgi:hypothetical protein
MKKVFQLSLFACALGSLSACMSVSQSSDDGVYIMKGASIPVGESLSDETAYSTFKYKKDRNQPRSTYYLGNNMSSMQGYNRFGNHYYVNPYSSWNSPYYNYNYGNYGYNSYGSMSMTPVWVYTPGWGWSTQMVMTNGYNPMYDPYSYNSWGGYNHNPYGYYGDYYGNNYYNNGYYNNGYYNSSNYYGNNNSNSGGVIYQAPGHHSGPRGTSAGGTASRNSAPGTLKSAPATAGKQTSQVNAPTSRTRDIQPAGSVSGRTVSPANGTAGTGRVANTGSSATTSRPVASGSSVVQPGSVVSRPSTSAGSGSPARGSNTESGGKMERPSSQQSGSGRTTPSISSPTRGSGNVGSGSTTPSRGSSGGGGGSSSPKPAGGRR